MNLNKTLENVGLTEKETKIYLALLELGESIPSVIAQRAKIKRPTAYIILQQLEKKALVSKIKKEKLTYYQAVSPHSLLEDQHQKFTALEQALPELLNLHKKYAVEPQVSFFEGQKGLIQIMNDTLTTSTDLLCWGDVDFIFKSCLQDYYATHYIKTKVKRNIWLRGVFSYDEAALDLQRKGEEELREVYLIPKEDFPFKNEINIYDDKVAIISHEDEVGVIIQNQNIADTQRSIFNFAFKYAKIAEAEMLREQL